MPPQRLGRDRAHPAPGGRDLGLRGAAARLPASSDYGLRVSQALTNLVQHYGLFAVLVLMAAESCGLPFPSEVIMPFSGALVAAGHLDLTGVILAGAVGNLAGSLVAYWLASTFGEPLLLGPGRYVGIRRSHLDLADRWFQRYGLYAVF